MIFALTKKNRKVLGIYKKLWNEIKKQIKAINSGESVKYKKDLMKISLNSYNQDLALGKLLGFSVLSIVVKSFFQNKNKYYPQIHINEREYEWGV